MFEKLICKFKGHEWLEDQDHVKRTCVRCLQYNILMEDPHPKIGEPKYFWKDATINAYMFHE